MKTWQDVFLIEYVRFVRDGKTYKEGYTLLDKRNGCRFAKCYPSMQYAETMAKRRFDRISKEIDELFISKEEDAN